MKKVISAKEMERLLKEGSSPESFSGDVILTPSARDILREHQRGQGSAGKAAAAQPVEPMVPDYEFKWKPGSDPKTPEAIQRFYRSPEIEVLKQRIVDIGRRIWEKDYVDGNGGNITIRVGDNLVLCTPTLISKGFMKPDDICLVDFKGNQLAGARKRTSEVNTHIGIMRYQPKAKSCVHAHPPHATAFAVASVEPPTCMIPEAEVFLGKIGISKYETPGTPENAEAVGRMGVDHQAIIMENHGVITWGKDVEDAYWKMENTDAYCKTVWIASQLGKELSSIGPSKLKELIAIRQNLGMDDIRANLRECELCDNAEFQPGVVCQAPDTRASGNASADNAEAEAMVQRITDLIMEQLKK